MIALSSNTQAIMPGRTARFLASGGTPPYAYALALGGAGGSIDPVTGVYQAPATQPEDPALMSDVVIVTDALAATTTRMVQICTVFMLLCDIIRREMGLTNPQVYVWDQKIMIPTDSKLYVAVGIGSVKPFSNNHSYDAGPSNFSEVQYANFQAVVTIDILSRGTAARDRKEEIVLALGSNYAQSQQELNTFYAGKLTTSFINLSDIDGAAIPYRYHLLTKVLYVVTKTKSIDYYDQFSLNLSDELLIEP